MIVPIPVYTDIDVKGPVVDGLRLLGIDTLRAQDDSMDGQPDTIIFQRANKLDPILVTHDTDLLVIAADCQSRGEAFFCVAFAHEFNINYGRCIAGLHNLVTTHSADELRNTIRYVPS